MSSKIFWKLLASVLFLAYALHHLFPLQTTPFDKYIETRATANQEDFKKVLEEARGRVTAYHDTDVPAEKKSKTIYEALRDIGAGRGKSGVPIKLEQFFTDMTLVNDLNIERRNNFVLQELLLQSQGKLKLGLDLQGGASFTLRIDTKHFEPKPEDVEAARKVALKEATQGLLNPEDPGIPAEQKAEVSQKWEEALTKADKRAKEIAEENASAAKVRLKEGLERVVTIMEGRVNATGVAEPMIRRVGSDSIEIQLPGADAANDPNIINALKKPAKLEFSMVHRYLRPDSGMPEHKIVPLRETPGDQASPIINYEVLYLRREDRKTGKVEETPYYVRAKADAGGNIIKMARGREAAPGEDTPYTTVMEFTSEGAKKFGQLTGAIADKNNEELDKYGSVQSQGALAIVLDGKLQQAPGLARRGNERYRAIDAGSAIIGANSLRDAVDLANVLNNPLEFELELQDSKQVGASLAEDAKEKSISAATVGIGLVLVFMVLYYLWAGLISVVGLVLNVVLMLGIMAAFQATITLPGVAALVLTVGMAVDANILIFERIREELSEGKAFKTAVQNGYDRAQATILDVNLTSLMSAVILMWQGTGPVRGFGVILAIGLVTTVFTSLVTCRALQEFCVNKNMLTHIFGLNLFKGNTKFRFLNVAKPAFTLSWIIALSGVAMLLYRGNDVLSKDFKGGEAAVVRVVKGKTPLNTGEIIAAAKAAGVGDVTANYQTALGGEQEVTLRIETELSATATKRLELKEKLPDFTQANKAVAAVAKAFPEHFPQGMLDDLVVGRESIGGAVSEGLQRNALLSMFLALLGIAIYVGLRFEAGMGMGAFLSSLHDVLLTSGLYILAGKQFSIAMIAAILMVIGYSINDTIVVFDRIREEMKRHPGMNLRDVIHLSINRTLSRTVLTSLTILLSAIALWLLGAGDVKEYGLIFVFGVFTGTFSSIYIASPIFYWWHRGERGSVEQAEAQVRYEWEAGSEAKAKS